MSNKLYDILKEIALVWLPAIGTLYGVLANIWGLPYGEEIVATVIAIDTFLGTVLHISNKIYKNKEEQINGDNIG
jgi:hypothetical protein